MQETRQAKEMALNDLAEILAKYSSESISDIQLEDDLAVITWEGGGKRTCSVGSDSVAMMICDVCREVVR